MKHCLKILFESLTQASFCFTENKEIGKLFRWKQVVLYTVYKLRHVIYKMFECCRGDLYMTAYRRPIYDG